MKIYKAAHLGKCANQVLEQYKHYTVSGVTSRGLFIAPPEKWVIFLSWEEFRGPLTINLPSGFKASGIAQLGAGVQVQECQIVFQNSDKVIDLSETDVWDPQLPMFENAPALRLGIHAVVKQLDDPFLQALVNQSAQHNAALSLIEEKILAFEHNQPGAVSGLLGLGAGLTPEGDDFLLGFAYILKIILENKTPSTGSFTWLEALMAEAIQGTTTLSANLIEGAAAGQADERIRDFVIALIRGKGTPGALRTLLGWGATSGRMVLAGLIKGLSQIA